MKESICDLIADVGTLTDNLNQKYTEIRMNSKSDFERKEEVLVTRILKKIRKKLKRINKNTNVYTSHPGGVPTQIWFEIKKWKEYKAYDAYIGWSSNSHDKAFKSTLEKYGLSNIIKWEYRESTNWAPYPLIIFDITDQTMIITATSDKSPFEN